MRFKVSSKVKGSLMLKSIGRPVVAGTTVHIDDHKLYASDTQRAIKAGLLVPTNPSEEKELKKEVLNKTAEAVIINKSDRVVIIGDISIRPKGSTIKEISKLDLNAIQNCLEKNLIQVIIDIDQELFLSKTNIKQDNFKIDDILVDSDSNLTSEDILQNLDDRFKTKDDNSTLSPEEELSQLLGDSEKKTSSGVWDFRTQTIKEAEVVPKSGQKMVDLEEEKVKKDNSIEHHTNKKEKEVMERNNNIVIELDSMGNPLQESSMNHMIGNDDSINEISFVD